MTHSRAGMTLTILALFTSIGYAQVPKPQADVEFQPLAAQVKRVLEALDNLGEPLPEADRREALDACQSNDPKSGVVKIQSILDRNVLAFVDINPESRVKVARGPAKPEIVETGWRSFLVKVDNAGGITSELSVSSPNAAPQQRSWRMLPEPKMEITQADALHRFADVSMYNAQPMSKPLSGLRVEYRILQIYCRDFGKRDITLTFDVGQGTQDLGFRSDISLLFESLPATTVKLAIKDHDGTPTTASLTFTDKLGRVYPSQSRRQKPDMFFQPQVYRADGESVRLPAGDYTVEQARGPEYLIEKKSIHVPKAKEHQEAFQLHRWIELKKLGWWSGDHHIHAAGCAHYDNPSQGVAPEEMFRYCVGEDLNVGCCLSWGPCWYFQKGFFEGKVNHLSKPDYLIRYDVEVSGFPSQHNGHLCLLGLKEDDYPGTKRIEQWPTWNIPILKWAKFQDAVVGYSHSGSGLEVKTKELPNYVIPPYSGIGANEYIIDVVHDAIDFISTVDTNPVWELNIWYHTLNCGYRCRISGETDFPCIFQDRVGLGRSYVKLPGKLDFEQWIQGIKAGRCYVSEGRSHLIDFAVNGQEVGTKKSQVDLAENGKVKVTAKVAAMLDPEPSEYYKKHSWRFTWHLEHARIAGTRKVPVELIVNGKPVARQEITADGSLNDVAFETPIEQSSWIALRVFPSSHTNPIFVHVAGKPIRASRKSAQWCYDSIEACWNQKYKMIRKDELPAARAAYDLAKSTYQRLILESTPD